MIIVQDFEFKERMFTSLVDLITLAIFLTITPQVRDAFSSLTRNERKDISAYKNFLVSVSTITRDSLWWLHDIVPKTFKPDGNTYTAMLYKSLFMTQTHEEYFRLDGFPMEADRALFFKLTADIPVQQETLLRIFLIGLAKSLPVNGQDCLTIAETLIKRAAGLHMLSSPDFQILTCNKAGDFMECVWQLTAYTYPESISLPQDYQPPSMAITASYWKAWQMLLIMTAYNPEEFGTVGWKNYPTLQALMEMCITNQFVFPPPTSTPEQADDLRSKDLQVANMEKQQILEFESQLAAASSKQLITEQNSLLLSTITSMDPLGPFRQPPKQILEQMKQINNHYKIGHLLCRSRKPDFLLEILQKQGTNQAMPWLADLVENSEGSFSVLPVQCLCEFLLNDALSINHDDQDPAVQARVKRGKAKELLQHLQHLLQNPASEASACLETLDYFLARLSSVSSPSRLQALAGLRILLTPASDERMETEDDDLNTDDDTDDWLLTHLPALPCFPLVYRNLSKALRQACQVETDPRTVSLYIRFLAQTCPGADGGGEPGALEELTALVLDLATVISDRSGLLPLILPGNTGHVAAISARAQEETYEALLQVYHAYMMLVRQEVQTFNLNKCEEIIHVRWQAEKKSAIIHITLYCAQIILLTHGNVEKQSEHFKSLLEMWFPHTGDMPRAYFVDTSDEAVLIYDWLKLKMIRSSIPILVDTALRYLEPPQLVLFIQSFGIPVDSMTKLLKTLDAAVQANFDVINDSVLDKTYMGQLVGVQHRRGAEGGFTFARALNLNIKLGDLNADLHEVSNVLPQLNVPPRSTAMIPPAHVKTTILEIFQVDQTSAMSKKERQDLFRTLQKLLSEDLSTSNKSPGSILEATINSLLAVIQSKDSKIFVTSMSQNPQFTLGLIRILSTALKKDSWRETRHCKSFLDFCKRVLKLLEPKKSTLNIMLQNFVKDLKLQGKLS